MSSVKLLKETLDKSYTTYKRTNAALVRATSGTSASSPRNLQLKIEAFKAALDDLNAAHTSWFTKVETQQEEDANANHEFSTAWLEGKWAEADELLDKAIDVLPDTETTSETPIPNQQFAILEQQMKSLQQSITIRIDTLVKEASQNNIPSTTRSMYSDMLSNAEKTLNTT